MRISKFSTLWSHLSSRLLPLVLLLATALVGCAGDGGRDEAPVPTLEMQPCNFDTEDVTEELRCGRLTVPLDRDAGFESTRKLR